jgi:hypothetical protein
MFKTITIDEDEILKLIEDCIVPARAVLQWMPAKGDEFPLPTLEKSWCRKPFSSEDLESRTATSSTACWITSKSSSST